ncbi:MULTISPECIES: bifunctional 2-polyprenyl-6-hydroxyphenol methylase/3-demethylubiquinol 3-O-methyltransferase UbiG [Cupriavidus]|uniref:Ubiquinone biosynthesis O-methyltransferase n=1 Tax=Cupriavidus pinatubonensis (strain JMP 134 / LMG 1197) TaxID=264198 RepID=UBIG_CUPPJ|nr:MULTISPECIES: bifunctional 2-polyprenyl-6-hydroxyphenol methylase/3-demethylubiquinol 3-O-methyltransferase UbiG [Cupriavidus]Q46Y42.1 RecName: Full=Ubiquinone biosynthesis O-methyltransferase; AltName: Full=2-polyprenyl-6-hydroxyphenol methylase; AltName: Full=3-demethylubiquinone 3-O-methyltransferase [Cupriavidus pinatubonensis JMP134]QYY33469.1 bifunctional 3-demethylubiquinone 3-O-methyltransferase/2-octaprenyl-6-hydroxy phenol methylase [Cupriavidus pinatubonensis]TPQ43271.1 bifunctiona
MTSPSQVLPASAGKPTGPNADPKEIDKFSELAHHWWDPNSEFKPLHDLNPLRLGWIDGIAGLAGKKVVDIGCGGGILSESMARLGANVRGIDLSTKALRVADLHSLESGVAVNYEEIAAEALAAREPGSVDVVTCMEMLEHVPDPESIVQACATLVRPGGHVFVSTINRNLKAYLMAVVGAEYILQMLPRGTHDYEKFITPSEMARFARNAGLDLVEMRGMTYNPLSQIYSLSRDTDVNYMMAFRRVAE